MADTEPLPSLPDSKRCAGRFAPSPTGPLHVGSLIAAVASHCDARAAGGSWRLRIDDIDPPREKPGALASIPRSLARFGLAWDGAIEYQSTHLDRYRAALNRLVERRRLYRCDCTRARLRDTPRYPLYPGYCRSADVIEAGDASISPTPLAVPSVALRIRLEGRVSIEDGVQGCRHWQLEESCGDIVVRRRDGLVAYPLASAVDDVSVDTVVRGADLLETTAAQCAILDALALAPPRWAHVPIAVDPDGNKLGKSAGTRSIDTLEPVPTLHAVWAFLGQRALVAGTIEDFWREARSHWSMSSVPRVVSRPVPVVCL